MPEASPEARHAPDPDGYRLSALARWLVAPAALVLTVAACSSGSGDATTSAGAPIASDGPDEAGDVAPPADDDGSPSEQDEQEPPPTDGDDGDDDGDGDGSGSGDADTDDAGDSGPDDDAGRVLPPEEAAANAAANIDDLEAGDDVRTLEVLDVKTGEPTSIARVVTGDRPVLLWFWAPH